MVTTINTTAHGQIIGKADDEVQRLATAQHEIEARLPAIQEELAAISVAAANRAQDLESIRRSLLTVQEAENKAKSYALLAHGTPAEATAVKAMRSATQDRKGHESALAKKEAAAARADQQDDARLAELRAELESKTRRLAQLSAERRSVEAAKAQALAELGASLYDEVRARVESLSEEIAARRQALLDAQLAMDSYLVDDALPRLNPWPEHVVALRQIAPHLEDGTSRVLNSAICYIDVLLAEGTSMASHIGPTTATNYLRDWRTLLSMPDDEIWSYEALNSNPSKLRARRDRLVQALTDYRRHALTQGRG